MSSSGIPQSSLGAQELFNNSETLRRDVRPSVLRISPSLKVRSLPKLLQVLFVSILFSLSPSLPAWKFLCLRQTTLPPPLTPSIRKELKVINLNPIYYSFHKLEGYYPKVSILHTPSPLSRNGEYLLRCDHCPVIYFGETGRSFTTRIHDLELAYLKQKPH